MILTYEYRRKSCVLLERTDSHVLWLTADVFHMPAPLPLPLRRSRGALFVSICFLKQYLLHRFFIFCNFEFADHFTQTFRLTAHLLAGSRTFL